MEVAEGKGTEPTDTREIILQLIAFAIAAKGGREEGRK
jgi:hypothetical protein